MTQDYPARGARAAVHRPGHALSVGGPPRRQHVRGAGLRRARGARAPGARRRPIVLARAGARLAQGGAQRRARARRPARRASSPSARRCRRCPDAAARRCRSTSRARSPISSSAPPSTSAMCTSRSLPAWPAPRCAIRARSTSAPSTRPTERVVATQVARKVVQLVFGRLDARTAAYGATAELLRRFFPGDYTIVTPGADATPRPAAARRRARAHRLPRAGGARGAARCSCARCAGSIRRCRGTRSCTPSAGRRPRRPCAPICWSACASSRTRRRRWPAPTSSSRPPTASPPRRG